MYSGKAGDALAGGGGMVEQWSASLSGMQFSTRDQVQSISFYQQQYDRDILYSQWLLKKWKEMRPMLLINRTMTATFGAAVLRRTRQDGGSTGETPHKKGVHWHRSMWAVCVYYVCMYVLNLYTYDIIYILMISYVLNLLIAYSYQVSCCKSKWEILP